MDDWTLIYRFFIGIVIFGFAVETISNFYKALLHGNENRFFKQNASR